MSTPAESSPARLESRSGRRPMAVAHRGFSAIQPENTLPAFAAAIPLCDYVETDVRRTRDGAAILFHDKTLRRTTNVAAVFPDRADDPVGTFDLAEVDGLDAGSWFGPGSASAKVPLLREGLELLSGTPCGMLLEVKEPIVDLVRDEVRAFLAQHPSFPMAVGSIDAGIARSLSQALPELPVGVLAVDQDTLTAEVWQDYADFATFLGFRHDRLRPDTIATAHAARLQVMHNSNTRDTMAEDAGDVHVTDDAALAEAAIRRRPGTAIEAEDLVGTATGSARAVRQEKSELSVRVPYKLSGGAAAVVTALRPGEWCQLTVVLDRAASVDVRLLATRQGGRYELAWDDQPVVELDTYASSPARRTVAVTPRADAGSHRLRCTYTGAARDAEGSELGIDVIMVDEG